MGEVDMRDGGRGGEPGHRVAAAKPEAEKRVEVDLAFLTQDGRKVTKTFSRRPLGMDYYLSMPMMVVRLDAGAPAEQAGVEVGWSVVAVDGESFETMEFEEANF